MEKQDKQARTLGFCAKTISVEDVKRIAELLYNYSAVLAGADCSELYVIGELLFDCIFEIFVGEVRAYASFMEGEDCAE